MASDKGWGGVVVLQLVGLGLLIALFLTMGQTPCCSVSVGGAGEATPLPTTDIGHGIVRVVDCEAGVVLYFYAADRAGLAAVPLTNTRLECPE